jgi:hypothetical protein
MPSWGDRPGHPVARLVRDRQPTRERLRREVERAADASGLAAGEWLAADGLATTQR